MFGTEEKRGQGDTWLVNKEAIVKHLQEHSLLGNRPKNAVVEVSAKLGKVRIGGNLIDMPRSLRVGPNGAPIYISGYTRSKLDLATPDAYNVLRGGGNDAFFAIINWNASKLLYSTYYGGSNSESVTEGGWYGPTMDLDSQGSIYISSGTTSEDSIATDSSYMVELNDPAQYDLFIAKFLNPCIDAFEPENNDFATAPRLLFNPATQSFSVKGTLESTNDKDYLRITGPQGFDSLYFHLTNLPFDCNLFVYDRNQQLLGKSQNSGTSDEELVLASTEDSTYYVLVKSPTHEFGTNDCYTLNISIDGSGKYSREDDKSAFNIFPNPADGSATLSMGTLINGDVRVELINSLGQIVWSQHPSANEASGELVIPLQKMRTGIYSVRILSEHNVQSLKLIVQH
jgi:hypothetical protein